MAADEPEAGHYLAGLRLAGRKVVVVGGGSVAQRRLPNLLAAQARVVVVAIDPTPAVEANPLVEVVRRPYADGDLDGAWYAIACTDDPAVNAAVADEAQRRRIFCVRADDARSGTAVTPASARHDGLAVGVLASGDHRRSAQVRDRLLAALEHSASPSTPPEGPHAPGVALVGGGPGAPDLITVRGRALLQRADVVVADRLAPAELLAGLRPDVEVIDAAKVPYGRAIRQEKINEILVDRARAGRFVVRLKGGDPYVFGRGFEEVQACVEAGVPVTVVPGVTSAISAPALAGIPVTHRGITHEVVIVSGHVAPDHPDSLTDWPELGRLAGTIVLMMGVDRLDEFAAALIDGGRDGQTPVAMIENASLPTQRLLRSALVDAPAVAREEGLRPPAIIVIGAVAGFLEGAAEAE
ncbi:uroporphyrinogen-III C-methyltransferase [Gordonia sp. (in: high G+C Gram-positive bacteria)]|uniref:uroporphyrinogen-III C-methyltransferase n=1 Tax=Gordonia sp. (in: high G+C Gram-positive bacteria) TaxID=84139 RepID=UPI0039E2D38F